jgi:hypothetical protein
MWSLATKLPNRFVMPRSSSFMSQILLRWLHPSEMLRES